MSQLLQVFAHYQKSRCKLGPVSLLELLNQHHIILHFLRSIIRLGCPAPLVLQCMICSVHLKRAVLDAFFFFQQLIFCFALPDTELSHFHGSVRWVIYRYLTLRKENLKMTHTTQCMQVIAYLPHCQVWGCRTKVRGITLAFPTLLTTRRQVSLRGPIRTDHHMDILVAPLAPKVRACLSACSRLSCTFSCQFNCSHVHLWIVF